MTSITDTSLLPLHAAVRRGDQEEITHLLAPHADIESRDTQNRTSLFVAAREGQIDAVRLLLKAGAEVNTRGEAMRITPLIVAAGRGDAPMVRLLLEAGADPNASGRNGAGALARAVVSGDSATVQALLEGGASPNGVRSSTEQEAPPPPNTSPLWAAVALKRHNLVKLLLAQGAQVNVGDSVSGTLFGTAVSGGDADIARMLLEAGADPLRPGLLNLPLLAVALRFTNLPMAELLEEYGLSLARSGTDELQHGSLDVDKNVV